LRSDYQVGNGSTVTKVISGGQTGVDQAALRAAIAQGIAMGGWCPPGRRTEDGTVPDTFLLRETPDDRSPVAPSIPHSQRTEWNVRDSDGTLILFAGALESAGAGTRWTAQCALRYGKPTFVADPADLSAVLPVRHWIEAHAISTLNVAGPRESSFPGIGTLAEKFVVSVLAP